MTRHPAYKGFTLIETLVAIAVLTLAVSGPLLTASRAAIAAETASYQLTASYLAQEGIEYLRAVRDHYYLTAYAQNATDLSNTAWNDYLAAVSACRSSNGSRTCTLDPRLPMGVGNSLVPCSGNSCGPLYLVGCAQTANGLSCTPPNYYTQSTSAGVATPYTRVIRLYDISATDERVESTVTWNFHNTVYTVTVNDHLTPWQ